MWGFDLKWDKTNRGVCVCRWLQTVRAAAAPATAAPVTAAPLTAQDLRSPRKRRRTRTRSSPWKLA